MDGLIHVLLTGAFAVAFGLLVMIDKRQKNQRWLQNGKNWLMQSLNCPHDAYLKYAAWALFFGGFVLACCLPNPVYYLTTGCLLASALAGLWYITLMVVDKISVR